MGDGTCLLSFDELKPASHVSETGSVAATLPGCLAGGWLDGARAQQIFPERTHYSTSHCVFCSLYPPLANLRACYLCKASKQRIRDGKKTAEIIHSFHSSFQRRHSYAAAPLARFEGNAWWMT